MAKTIFSTKDTNSPKAICVIWNRGGNVPKTENVELMLAQWTSMGSQWWKFSTKSIVMDHIPTELGRLTFWSTRLSININLSRNKCNQSNQIRKYFQFLFHSIVALNPFHHFFHNVSVNFLCAKCTRVAEHMCDRLTLLRDIDLSGNKLTSLSSNIFKFNTVFGIVNLRGNQLELLPANIFHQNRIEALNLHENPWKCDCDFLTIVRSYENGIFLDSKCADGEAAQDKLLTNACQF